MIKKILAGVCLVFSTVAFSQQNNASPYSYYGIGDIQFKGTVENRSMGGLGILPDSTHVNLQNPASYSSLKFTTYTVGASNKSTSFKSGSGSDNADRTTFDYLAVALPFNKLGFSFGLMPYTSVGYKITNNQVVDNVTYNREFEGSGGLNRAFLGAAYKVTSKLSVGLNAQYNFGNIETRSVVKASGVQYPTREINEAHYGGISFNLGATYQTKLNKLDWISSATFTPKSTLSSRTDRSLATILQSTSGAETEIDEIDYDQIKDDTKMPSVFTVGTGFGMARKWFAGIEYTTQSSNTLGNRFDAVTNAKFESSKRVTLGGYYIPNFMSYTSYLSRITYRGGVKYEKMGLVVNNQSIDDVALTFGMGLPLGAGGFGGGSNLNVGFEIGKRGIDKSNLIQENYVNVMVSLSLNDRWFIKRKYE